MTFADIASYLAANQFLTGGIGTVALGGALYVLREAPRALVNTSERIFTTALVVTSRNTEFDEVGRLLNVCRVQSLTRNFIPSYREEDALTAGYGKGVAVFEGTLIIYERAIISEQGVEIQEKITCRFWTRSASVVSRFLRSASDLGVPGKIKAFVSDNGWYVGVAPKHKRALDTVFVPDAVKTELVDRLGEFIRNEQWFLDRGIPYKFCGLLYGPPGTGKTSLVHAIASEYDLRIKYVTSLQAVDALIRHCTPIDLVVIEDIDALEDDLTRDPEKPATAMGETMTGELTEFAAAPQVIKVSNDKGKPVLHKLLNSLDGLATPHGLKVLITTNNKDKLDPALVRPGRMDVMLEIGPMEASDIVRMYAKFYGPAKAEILQAYVDGGGSFGVRTGAALQELFARNGAGDAWMVLTEEKA